MALTRISFRVSRRVRRLLQQTERTQEWLSMQSGIPMRTLARRLHEVNPSPMSIDELDTIAALLGVSIADLVADDAGIKVSDLPAAVAS